MLVVKFAVIVIAVVALVILVRTWSFGPPAMRGTASAPVDQIDQEAAALHLSEAIRIRTISFEDRSEIDPLQFTAFRDFLESSYPRVHRQMSRESIAGHSLLYTWAGSDPALEPILFSAHMDVVPVEPETEGEWQYPPFSGAIADGFVWGRGSLDMKQSLVGYMEAAETLLAAGFTPRRTILFAFTHDEELGASAAREIADFLEKRGTRLFFTLDEGLVITNQIVPGVDKPVALIGLAQKGYVTVELTVRGKGGHASVPPSEPLNVRLAKALLAVSQDLPLARLQAPASQMFEYLAPELGFLNRVVLANRWLFGPIMMSRLAASAPTNAIIRSTFAPTIVQSGFKANALPQEGKVAFNIRILPGESIKSTLDRIREQVGDPDIAINVVGNEPSEPSPVSDVNSQAFRIIRQTVHQVFPDVVTAPGLLVGRTDSRRYRDISANSFFFLPSRLSADDLARIHGTNERIAIDNYVEIIGFYAQLIRNSAGDGADK